MFYKPKKYRKGFPKFFTTQLRRKMSLVNAPVQDLLIRIKNAYLARRYRVENVVYSNFKVQVLELLKRFRFIKDFSVSEEGNKKFLSIELNVTGSMKEDVPVIKFYSKPSRRWYVSYSELKPVAGGVGIGIISTSQ